ncbi:MAG TPA: ABC transporter permease [Blastocatellia bacterium]|nr:ABC transporter permease [Blastocatellia bacterium]
MKTFTQERSGLATDEREMTRLSGPFAGLLPVLRKEAIHLRRDPMALFFTVLIPVLQLMMIGFAINTNVRDVPTVVYDAAQTQESRRLLDRFVNSGDFKIISYVTSDEELNGAVVAGRAQVGIKIPPDYSRRLLAGETASALVLVDGSDSSVAGETSNVSNAITLQESLDRVLERASGRVSLPIEARRKVLFNPDSRSANFLIPGLIVVLMQMQTVMLTTFAIVRERERGTLEQLYMTPVAPLGLMVGKIIPYLVVAFVELCLVLTLMVWAFSVPIHGSLPLLLGLAVPFMLTMLGVGLLISTRAQTQNEAMQMSFGTMMPSIFLSGYIFPIAAMPLGFRFISQLIPTTYMIQIARGIILRGASLYDLRQPALVLTGMSILLIFISAMRFRKKAA